MMTMTCLIGDVVWRLWSLASAAMASGTPIERAATELAARAGFNPSDVQTSSHPGGLDVSSTA
jgi:hypothetical protein